MMLHIVYETCEHNTYVKGCKPCIFNAVSTTFIKNFNDMQDGPRKQARLKLNKIVQKHIKLDFAQATGNRLDLHNCAKLIIAGAWMSSRQHKN